MPRKPQQKAQKTAVKNPEQGRRFGILRMLVDEFVDTVEPVGSEVLREKHRLTWSPATIRNDFSTLEEDGYLEKPHTSGGRVPTEKAYRFVRDVVIEEIPAARWNAWRRKGVGVMPSVGALEARMPGVVRHLAHITGHLVFGGSAAGSAFSECGLPNLVREPEFADQESVANVAAFIERVAQETAWVAREVVHGDLGVYVGGENRFPEIRTCSLLVSSLRAPDGADGFLAMLGPMRMPYGRNVSYLTQMAEVFAD